MFRKVHVPLLGLVENMATYTCPKCGHSEHIFGSGGGAAAAEELGMELLGQVSVGCTVHLLVADLVIIGDVACVTICLKAAKLDDYQ